jgi:hypothetical protein
MVVDRLQKGIINSCIAPRATKGTKIFLEALLQTENCKVQLSDLSSNCNFVFATIGLSVIPTVFKHVHLFLEMEKKS